MSSKRALVISVAILGSAGGLYAGFLWLERSDFDRMCAVVTEATTDSALAKMHPVEKQVTLTKRIQAVLYAPSATESFHAIALADPIQRMELMKQAAEEVRGAPWDCPALDQVFSPRAR